MNYQAVAQSCISHRNILKRIVDKFLLPEVMNSEKLRNDVFSRFDVYKHIIRDFEKEWVTMYMYQYLMHRIFKKNGIINNYLNHKAIQRLTSEEKEYLFQLASYPWRFSFSVIINQPKENFFEMEDVFTGETFLLFSENIQELQSKYAPSLWFNLIGYSGSCWQTYGPINYYQSFTPDDIFFFATELHPSKIFESDEDIVEDVESNPVPYMMLVEGALSPIIMSQGHSFVHVLAEYEIEKIDAKSLANDFVIDNAKNVIRLKLSNWCEHPHWAVAYYDERKKTLLLSATTDMGFDQLVACFNKHGYDIPYISLTRVTPGMLTTAQKILKRKIRLSEDYEKLFEQKNAKTAAKDEEFLVRMNNFLDLIMTEINAGKQPDIESLAAKADVDIDTAKQLMNTVLNMIKK